MRRYYSGRAISFHDAPVSKHGDPERMVLTDRAHEQRGFYFENYGSYGNCSCHLGHPPCGSCTHPGNPLNQQEDDSCWRDMTPEEERDWGIEQAKKKAAMVPVKHKRIIDLDD